MIRWQPLSQITVKEGRRWKDSILYHDGRRYEQRHVGRTMQVQVRLEKAGLVKKGRLAGGQLIEAKVQLLSIIREGS